MEDTHETLMDRSGMGPLVGIALAFFVVLAAMLALLLDSYAAMAVAFVALVATLVVVALVIAAIAGEDEDGGRARRKVPGLG